MNLLNIILDLAALLLWIDWRSGRAFARTARPVISITNSLRETERSRWRGWRAIGGLLTLLLVRAVFYWNIGSNLDWTARVDLVAISIPLRSDSFPRMVSFSFASFALTLGIFFSWMLLLSALNRALTDLDPVQRVVRLQLGWLEKLPSIAKLLAPPIVAGLLWAGIAPFLTRAGLLPAVKSPETLWKQAGVVALSAFLAWKWLFILLFAAHFLNLYVYLGTHPIWNYVTLTSRKLLRPLSFIQFGKLDLSPVVGIAFVMLLSNYLLEPFVIRLFTRFTL